MSPKSQKSGYPFIIFLVLVTVFLSYWLLRTEREITEESEVVANLTADQLPNINEPVKGIIEEDQETKTSTFQNPTYGFKIALLEDETIKETTSEGIYSILFNEDTINVMDESMEGIIRESIGILVEEEVIIGGLKGTKIDGSSAKDGSRVILILVKKEGKLYHFQGSDDFLERMIKDFTFTN